MLTPEDTRLLVNVLIWADDISLKLELLTSGLALSPQAKPPLRDLAEKLAASLPQQQNGVEPNRAERRRKEKASASADA